MAAFASSPVPEMTIWGAPLTTVQRLPGLWRVTTASHGGFILSAERQAAMPEALRLDGPEYEHDVNWSLVIVAFADEFATAADPLIDIELGIAMNTVKSWKPERYAAFAGEAIEPHQSYIRRDREAYEARIGKIVVTCAYGDWSDWVSPGKVGLIGQRLISVNHIGVATYDTVHHKALADAAAYGARGSVISFDELKAEPIS